MSKDINKMVEQMPLSVQEEALYPTGFEDAVVGYVERYGMAPVILLDREKCESIMVKRDGMTWEEAREYFEFNVLGAYLGEATPAFMTKVDDE